MLASARWPVLAGFVALCGAAAIWNAEARAEHLLMKVNGWTNPPVGYLDFCRRFPDQCVAAGSDLPEDLTQDRWGELETVNSYVNRSIIPVTDKDYYHQEEFWTIPDSHGDCEDYVLLKRKLLETKGWPTGSLLVAVVFDEVGDGHAVLLVRTSRGDFVLDNKTDEIRAWYGTAYKFVKRQSVGDPNRWVSVGDPRWTTPATATPK